MISPNDLDLLFVTDELDEAVDAYAMATSSVRRETGRPVKADAQ